mgnify:CR=1 FL=1
MKSVFKIFGIVCLTFLAFSCSKDDDPADNDLFVGTYNGSVSYTDGDESISAEDGSVTVAKVGNNYNFAFSNGIPNITGVEFEEDGDNSLINIGWNDTQLIRITASSLEILYIKDGETWTADCER